jgi:hypothetical protein
MGHKNMKKMIKKNRAGFSKNLLMAAVILLSISFVAYDKDDDGGNDPTKLLAC